MQRELYNRLDKLAMCYGPDWSSGDAGNEVEKLCEQLQVKLEDWWTLDLQIELDALTDLGIALDAVRDFETWMEFSAEWSKNKDFWRQLDGK